MEFIYHETSMSLCPIYGIVFVGCSIRPLKNDKNRQMKRALINFKNIFTKGDV